jgi:hypothetical protein
VAAALPRPYYLPSEHGDEADIARRLADRGPPRE